MTRPLPEVRRLSTGVIDIDFYRRQITADQTAYRNAILRRFFAAVGSPLAKAPPAQAHEVCDLALCPDQRRPTTRFLG